MSALFHEGKSPRKPDTSHLDGLRGLAALCVVVSHCMIWGSCPYTNVDPKLAVDLFMLISGFLMVSNAILRHDREPLTKGSSWTKFYLRRYFRLAPAYYVELLVAVLLAPYFLPGYKALQPTWQGTYDSATIHFTPVNLLMHVTFLFGLSPYYSFSTMLPDWSLGLEMQFYAVFPIMFLLMRRFGYLPVALVLGIGGFFLAPYFLDFREPSFLPLKISCFLAGMVIGWASWYRQSMVSLALIIVVICFILSLQSSVVGGHTIVLPIMGVLLLGLSCNQSERGCIACLRRGLGGRIGHWLSEMSYSVYLFHGFFISMTAYFLFNTNPVLNVSGAVKTEILIAITVPGVLLVSIFTSKYIEKPGISLGHWIARRLVKPQVTAVTAGTETVSTRDPSRPA